MNQPVQEGIRDKGFEYMKKYDKEDKLIDIKNICQEKLIDDKG